MVTIARAPAMERVLPEARSWLEVHDYVKNLEEGSLTTVITDRGSEELSERYADFM